LRYIREKSIEEIHNKYIICAHRRSGSHFFLAALRQIRSRYKMQDATIRHWEPDHPLIKEHCGGDLTSAINLVRDGRDVMVSCYHYYKAINKDISNRFKDVSFQDYLHGRVEIKNPDGVMGQYWSEQMFFDPVGYWKYFVESWLPYGILVKYEDMLERFDIPLCGYKHRKGIHGDYVNHFTGPDHQYFWSKAGDLMTKLGYRR
jgi:hypothetical protein